MIVLKKKFYQVGQAWFSPPESSGVDEKVDFIEYIQCQKPLDSHSAVSEFHTLVVDLTQPLESIQQKFHKDTQYEIRRAARDGFRFQVWDKVSSETLQAFCDFYDEFALQKNRGRVGRSLLASYADAGVLGLSSVSDASEILTWHAYLVMGDRVRLLQSASHYRQANTPGFRSAVGRANRFHHWQDISHYHDAQKKIYDLGGWYEGKTDTDRLNINKFKEEFGGTPVLEYGYTEIKTWVGKLYAWANQIRRLMA
jgi:hypothetical protein